MSCETCLQAKPLPRCLSILTIGTATADTEYVVRLKSSALGKVDYIDSISDGAGLIQIDATGIEFTESVYTISIKKKSDGSSKNIVVGAEDPVECIEVAFEDGTLDTALIEVKE